jgi:hypothetical protein
MRGCSLRSAVLAASSCAVFLFACGLLTSVSGAKPGKEANVLGDKVQQLMDLTTKRSVLRSVSTAFMSALGW